MMTTTMTRGMLVMIALLTLVSVLAYSFFEWYVRVQNIERFDDSVAVYGSSSTYLPKGFNVQGQSPAPSPTPSTLPKCTPQ